MTRRAPHVTRAATLGGALALIILSSADGVRTQTAAPGRVIWRGVMTEMTSSPSCEEQVVQTFEFEGDERETGTTWRSRKVTWNQSLTCAKDVLMLVDEDGDATTPSRRMLRPWGGSCANQGEADLQSTPDPSVRSRCQETPRLGFISARTLPTLGWTGPRPDDQMRDGCAFNTRSRTLGSDGTVGLITVSITVSRGQPDAVVEVNRPEYDAFVPEPGKTLTFTARSARPARFRFELERDGTSRFPGYATNANVDDAFFATYNLHRLRGQYPNDGPDFVFYPSNFAETEWARIDQTFVESGAAQHSVAATVTAMDYGAVGRLRAYVESADCGGTWQPVPAMVNGQRRDAIDIPLDADNNLIADALEPYRGLDSGADDDAEPKGNGMAGDGLTAFEEYRGFLTTTAPCPEAASIAHARTRPRQKDVFVHTLDPEYMQALELFGWSSGLDAHGICESHYVNNATRVVNFTLQHGGLRRWAGHVISQEVPQHGLWLINYQSESWPTGIVCTNESCTDDVTIGPPGLVYNVRIDKDDFPETTGARSRSLVKHVVHELGHAVGIPHHSDTVTNWIIASGGYQNFDGPLVVEPGGDCTEAAVESTSRITPVFIQEKFVGCYVTCRLVRHGGQNSGDSACPMRYVYGTVHETAGADSRWHHYIRNAAGERIPVFTGGPFFSYDNDRDIQGTGQFCRAKTGTALNDSARGNRNHAGEAVRVCVDYLVVNDGVLPRGGR
jgi:hypothetical protein